MHQQIIDKELATVPSGRKEFHFVTGHSASGKSRFVDDVIDQKNNLVIDADRLKPKIPEYGKKGGAFVHDETTDVTQNLVKQAVKQNKPIVFVGNVKDSEKYQSWIQLLKDRGYNVTADEVKVPKNVALHRSVQRSMSRQPVPIVDTNEAYKTFTGGSDLLRKNVKRFASYSGESDFLPQITEGNRLPNFYKK